MQDGRDFFIEQPSGLLDLHSAFAGYGDTVMDIGFGTGEATAQMALNEPQIAILAVDVHTPGIGDLLHRCAHTPLPNVRVMSADALEVLTALPPDSLAGVRTYFPDPWPKARHHKRRLIQEPVLDLVASRVRLHGFWHLATDWAEYADAMQEAFDSHPMWAGGVITRPDWRPVTRYERNGLSQGREPTDLMYTRVTP
jgi:tRNA (guanine-N7-)-methyltransferase